jgi:hypothetical protein
MWLHGKWCFWFLVFFFFFFFFFQTKRYQRVENMQAIDVCNKMSMGYDPSLGRWVYIDGTLESGCFDANSATLPQPSAANGRHCFCSHIILCFSVLYFAHVLQTQRLTKAQRCVLSRLFNTNQKKKKKKKIVLTFVCFSVVARPTNNGSYYRACDNVEGTENCTVVLGRFVDCFGASRRARKLQIAFLKLVRRLSKWCPTRHALCAQQLSSSFAGRCRRQRS